MSRVLVDGPGRLCRVADSTAAPRVQDLSQNRTEIEDVRQSPLMILMICDSNLRYSEVRAQHWDLAHSSVQPRVCQSHVLV